MKDQGIKLDALFLHDENGQKTLKGWVHEDGLWSYRTITEAELEKISPLLQYDLSELKKGIIKPKS